MRISPFKIGMVAAIAAVGMILAQVAGYDWFLIQLGGIRFPLWTLVAVYAGLQFTIWKMTRDRLQLSDDEVAQWGEKLELATPTILELYGERKPVKTIAEAVAKRHGVPSDVTLRYIIALARHARQQQQQNSGT